MTRRDDQFPSHPGRPFSFPAGRVPEHTVTKEALQQHTEWINQDHFEEGIAGYEIVASLPASGDFEGQLVYNQADGKLYRWTGTEWTSKIATADLEGTVTTEQLEDGSVTTVKLGDASVTSTKIGDSQVTEAKIGDASVTETKLGAGSVTEAKIGDAAVTTQKLGAGSVTTVKIGDDQITTAKLNDGAVTSTKLGDAAVTNTKIDDGAVTELKIGAAAVTVTKLGDGAVTETKLGEGAVTNTKLDDGAVTEAKLGNAAVTATKLGDGAVTEAKIDDAAVTVTKIGDGAVTELKIGDLAVTTDKLGDSAVEAAKVANRAIGANKMDAVARAQHGVFMEIFDEIPEGIDATSGVTIVAGEGVTGGNVMRVSGVYRNWYDTNRIPFDPSKYYRVRVRIRVFTDNGANPSVDNELFYCGVRCYDADLVQVTAGLTSGNAYFVASSKRPVAADGWVEYTGWIHGHGTYHANADDPTNPTSLPAATAYISPMALINYSTPNVQVTDFDYYVIDAFDEDSLVRTYLGLNVDGVVAADKVVSDSILADAIIASKIAAGAVVAGKIATDAVIADNIVAGAIVADKIGAGAVLAEKIAAGAVIAEKIGAGAVIADKIAAGAVVAGKLAADSVVAANIAAGEIVTAHMVAGSILGDRIAVGTLETDRLVADWIDAGNIKAGALTAAMIGATEILTKHIKVLEGGDDLTFYNALQNTLYARMEAYSNILGNGIRLMVYAVDDPSNDATAEALSFQKGDAADPGTMSWGGDLVIDGVITAAGFEPTMDVATQAWVTANFVNVTGDTLTGGLTISSAGEVLNFTGSSKYIMYSASGVNTPTVSTRSAGTKIVLYPGLSASAADYALGISSAALWISVPSASSTFRWFAGTNEIATLSGAGAFQIDGGLSIGATEVITSARVLQNVTANTSILTAGTIGVARGGTGIATATAGNLLLGAGTSAMTLLAPGAAGGYVRSNGTAWARVSGVDAADLTGTVASARLSGGYSGITALGNLTALNMAGNILPTTDNSRSIGSASFRLANIHAVSVTTYGVTGVVLAAQGKLWFDGAVNSYMYESSDNVVDMHLASSNRFIRFSPFDSASGISDFSTGNAFISFSRTSDGSSGVAGIGSYNDGSGIHHLLVDAYGDIVFGARGTAAFGGNPERLRISDSYIMARTHFRPSTSSTYDLGMTGDRWRDIYATGIVYGADFEFA